MLSNHFFFLPQFSTRAWQSSDLWTDPPHEATQKGMAVSPLNERPQGKSANHKGCTVVLHRAAAAFCGFAADKATKKKTHSPCAALVIGDSRSPCPLNLISPPASALFATLGRTLLKAEERCWDVLTQQQVEFINEALEVFSHPYLVLQQALKNNAVGPALAESRWEDRACKKMCKHFTEYTNCIEKKSKKTKNSLMPVWKEAAESFHTVHILTAAFISFFEKIFNFIYRGVLYVPCLYFCCIKHKGAATCNFITLFYIMTTNLSSHRWSRHSLIHAALIMTLTQSRDIMQINLSALTCWWTRRSRLCVCARVWWMTNLLFFFVEFFSMTCHHFNIYSHRKLGYINIEGATKEKWC